MLGPRTYYASFSAFFLGHEVDHSRPNIELENEWSYTTTPPYMPTCRQKQLYILLFPFTLTLCLMLQFWSAYVPCSTQHLDAVQLALEQIDVIRRLVAKYPTYMTLVTTTEGKLPVCIRKPYIFKSASR